MCKAPNKSKITTFLRQCLTSASAKADLSALYSPSDLSVEQVELEDMRTYHVYARCNLPHGVCPYCGHVSRSVHSRYHRTIADLSIIGHPVIITFEARKFFCHNPDCRIVLLKLSVLITMNIEAPCAMKKFKKLQRSILDKSYSKKSKSYRPRDSTSPRYPRSWILPDRP